MDHKKAKQKKLLVRIDKHVFFLNVCRRSEVVSYFFLILYSTEEYALQITTVQTTTITTLQALTAQKYDWHCHCIEFH
jgi:hypothetical protein